MSGDKYASRGVSADKSEVHEAIKNLDKGIFPYAFCKILPDVLAGSPEYCSIMHADTAGTKTSLAYMYWKETGDISVWEGIVQDALVMNLDDMACSGCIDNIIVSSTIGRNKHLVTGEVLKVLIGGAQKFFKKMEELDVNILSAGGETADVGDIVRTADVGFTAFGRLKRCDVIDTKIKKGDYIVGLASYGQASYETEYNAGMGSNGLTIYKSKYPETFDPNTNDEFVYSGSKLLTDTVEIDGKQIPLGKLVLSPTRTFLPVLKKVIDQYRPYISGIIHNTGGAHTKVTKYLSNPLTIIKDKLLPVPPLFKIIKEESSASDEEMYKVFNMGTRLEIYAQDIEVANAIIAISRSFNIDADIVGRVEEGTSDKSVVRVKNEEGKEITIS